MKWLRNLAAAAVIVGSLVLGTGAAHAATSAAPNATITITGGTLSISSSGSLGFTGVTLDGSNQSTTGASAPTFSIVDPTGSGSGWNVTFIASDLTSGANTIAATGFTYAAGSSKLGDVAGQPADATNGPVETGVSGSLSTAKKVVATQAGYGMGQYTYTPTAASFALAIPSTTKAGSYSGTLTATITTAP